MTRSRDNELPTIMLRRTNAADASYRTLVVELDADLRERYGAIQDQYAPLNVLPTDMTVVLAEAAGRPLGCGAMRTFPYAPATIEIKRMYVAPRARRHGIARAVLSELANIGRERDAASMVLETGNLQHEAIALYESWGFERIDAFPPYAGMPASICMRKAL